MYNIAIAQSGGPTAAINASLTGVFTEAAKNPMIDEIYGVENGIEGILSDRLLNLRNILMDEHDITLLMHTPSTILGSCRFKLKDHSESEEDYRKILETFEKHNIKAFFYIGGNDSMDTVLKLSRYFAEKGIDIKVIGVPKTIDNDLPETDHTPGFGSAAKYVATSLQEIIRDSRVYSIPSVTIVEIMGRDAGWLTASSCVLRANGEPAPHLIYLPERPFSPEKYLEDVKKALDRYKAVLVAVSEGIRFPGAHYDDKKDAFGHTQNAGIGKILENYTKEHLNCKVRSIELNVMQRCSSHIASLTDLNESKRAGEAAADFCINNGQTGVMVVLKRLSNNPYRVEMLSTPVENVANKEKKFPTEWINSEGNNVSIDALNYFLPLIHGEPMLEYRNGVPVHFRLDQ
ncbi:MAG: 6-phosphofructokinase [Lachnospiraceae bacterium]|nr:6-phosphofructokinase [Lachnospiraceae bacterium]